LSKSNCPIANNKGLLIVFINKFIHSWIVGCWVGFWWGWAKLDVLQKRWLVCRLAALLILRSVGILSVVSTNVDGLHCRHSLAGNSCIHAILLPFTANLGE
jgi:hypothetical protein